MKKVLHVNEKLRLIGESHGRAKLNYKQVEEIREKWEDGFHSYAALAREYGVHKSTIADIVRFRKWASTPYPHVWKRRRNRQKRI